MGRHTILCPVTGEIITQSGLPNGQEPTWYYSPGASKEAIEEYEKRTKGQKGLPAFHRHPHQV